MKFKRAAAFGAALPLAAAALGLGGCANWAYYWQSVGGHARVLVAAQPVSELLADPSTEPALKERLALAQRIRAFASAELALPSNHAYTRYTDLKRAAVVWNVVAAPADSLQLKTWCFAVAGCVSYRGYYEQASAQAHADALAGEGYEVSVYGVPAYSTLGKLDALGAFGADPLLNTFVKYPEGELARLIFHELAHQVAYAPDDSTFNESFASAVERLGAARWFAAHPSALGREAFALRDERAAQYRTLVRRTRERLQAVYAEFSNEKMPKIAVDIARPAMNSIAQSDAFYVQKTATMAQFRAEYAALKQSDDPAWRGYSGYDAAVARANNATVASMGTYDDLVPQFMALFEASGRDFAKFYDAVQALAKNSKAQRRERLKALPLAPQAEPPKN